MSLTPEDAVAEVRSRADIVEIVADVVVLKRTGRNFTGLCPFHQERSPSFNVNPERQIFRCFGCGEGGDVFSFIMKTGHLTFPEALKTLADRYGVTLPDRRPESDDRVRIREANEVAAAYYSWLLEHAEHGARGRAYLDNRGVSADIRKRFRLGISPDGWDGLHKHLLGQNVPAELQVTAALARPRPGGNGHYDYFRNRLMFPILNEAAQVVAFGARALAAEDEPKYLNSPETALYRKGNILYGLSEARDSIRKADRGLLMEGYMDVIMAHAYGFTEAVGVLGTALTTAQARTLLRYTPSRNVVLAFDADRAGQNAAERGIQTLTEVAQGVGLHVKVLSVPAGKDPDAYLRAEGAVAFGHLIDEAPDLFQFLLVRAISTADIRTFEGKARAVTAAVPILRQIENYVTQEHYVNWLSAEVGVRHEDVRLEIGRTLRHNKAPSLREVTQAKKLSTREAERILLFFMVERRSVRDLVREKLADIRFDGPLQVIRETIESLLETKPVLVWTDLTEAFTGDEALQKVVSHISFSDYEAWGEESEPVIEDCVLVLQIAHWQAAKNVCHAKLKEPLTPDENRIWVERFGEIATHLIELDRSWRKLNQKGPASKEQNA